MPTIEEIKRENKKLRAMQESLNDMKKIQEERTKLLKENRRLAINIKHGKKISVGKTIGKTIGKSVGKGILRVGKGTFRGLQRYSNYLQEQEMKQKALNRKLKSLKKKK